MRCGVLALFYSDSTVEACSIMPGSEGTINKLPSFVVLVLRFPGKA